ncbi:MAG: glycerol-3-phosphate acyltransferase [Patescibacteria group bacterium]
MDIVLICLYCLLPFCLGVPSGGIISRLKRVNIRSLGSGNPGATNMSRILGWKYGVFTLLIDISKSFIVVAYLSALMYSSFLEYIPNSYVSFDFFKCLFAISVVLGNVFSPFFGFTGGKGIATALGAIIGMAPIVLLIGIPAFLIFLVSTEYMSVASISSIISVVCGSLVLRLFYDLHISVFCFSSTVFLVVLWTHRKNLARLQNGTEPKFSFKKKNPSH